MKKKGVSPVIATVLLIGMVIALALIVFIWMRAFVKETITKFDGQNVELVCNDVKIQASYAGGQLSIFNLGNVPIYDIRIKTSSAAGLSTESAREVAEGEWPKYGLNPGATFLGSISLGGDVTLIPILLGNSEKVKKFLILMKLEMVMYYENEKKRIIWNCCRCFYDCFSYGSCWNCLGCCY